MVVAAIAEANGCLVVTDNERHFSGVEFLNPLREGRRKGAMKK
jgi:predicted nucleic acid-binding protein